MRFVVAGAHGKVAQQLARLLVARGDEVVGLVRSPEHLDDLAALGVRPRLVDLEAASVPEVAEVLEGADAAVFAAGAGPGSGAARKDTVDRGAAVLLADACERAGVRRYLLVSSVGVESVRDGAEPEGVEEVFLAYLRAKLAAEEDVRARDLDWTVLRPGALTDAPATGRVLLEGSVPRGEVPRADVAAVLVALADTPGTAGQVLELVGGEEPVEDAVRRAAAG
ncbi:SDR family oxidoreductase [Vallicoccus soli]|uniref:SDR family oxidoreductase n=1 Tax=Vallicoccus soli TaxID=2339232 RepID=A0A3A3Z4C8_9ACTN|nr:SDR family oxidoreductase [Vallicoccus soli]RJK96466.1 SDR family oxidoreductase [Vallicoccus soli]